mmetsp:Transcript_1114/g.2298  ORF Transcript_1114/g.2298 Transcript_1114/m.2298 type:complete len:628 (+) Transcript_1114:483-2366(+)|eukprot:CAMPEP_0114296464 /NCGR_PEP_ID=MMETSP0059-20121206/11326_1 /TAXON_ID=36894 /ORGANISM="Pyramimonas parkeae, Strain CCMP726" /LENGTH=627 /DNA_ID=CAMNT_0001418615 /DNA_START=375 /DNA_END=2258 /DNA_ORIENTATION=+
MMIPQIARDGRASSLSRHEDEARQSSQRWAWVVRGLALVEVSAQAYFCVRYLGELHMGSGTKRCNFVDVALFSVVRAAAVWALASPSRVQLQFYALSSFYISAAVYLLLKYTGGASEAAQDGPAQGQCSVRLLRVAVGLSVLSLLVGWAQIVALHKRHEQVLLLRSSYQRHADDSLGLGHAWLRTSSGASGRHKAPARSANGITAATGSQNEDDYASLPNSPTGSFTSAFSHQTMQSSRASSRGGSPNHRPHSYDTVPFQAPAGHRINTNKASLPSSTAPSTPTSDTEPAGASEPLPTTSQFQEPHRAGASNQGAGIGQSGASEMGVRQAVARQLDFLQEQVTEAEVDALLALSERVRALNSRGQWRLPPEGPDLHFLMLRFVRARDACVDKALEMLVAMLNWRLKEGVDGILESGFEFPEGPEVLQFYPHAHHKVDKLGRPVYIVRMGLIDPGALLQVTTMERLERNHVHEWEKLLHIRFPACSQEVGRRIHSSTSVFDLDGVSLYQFHSARTMLQRVLALDQDFYPEHLGELILVNTPWIFKSIWSMIVPWLGKRTQRKARPFSMLMHLKSDYKTSGFMGIQQLLIVFRNHIWDVLCRVTLSVGQWSELGVMLSSSDMGTYYLGQ